MPIFPGKKNIGRNIKELEQPSANAPNGRPQRQALAIALRVAGVPPKGRKTKKGKVRGKK